MTLPVVLEPEATSELEAASRWYDSKHRGLGLEFLTAVDQAIQYIIEWPDAGTLASGVPSNLPVRMVPVVRFPYRVAYLVTTAAIRVLAIAHDHRRPGYWHARTRP